MLDSPCERITYILISLATCLFASPRQLPAQFAPRALIVVADASDAECVKRIAREHVRVERLIDPESGAWPTNYEACNERARGLLEFRLYLFRADIDCPGERFWRERLSVANPNGELHCLLHSRRGVANDFDHRTQQATDIHRVLIAALPELRESLDANLQGELDRLRRLSHQSLELAVRE
ncbi:MAG: hypothetical protein U0795_22750 [Pirellulales bacterium]